MTSDSGTQGGSFPELRAALESDHSLSYREEHIVRLRFGLDVTSQCHTHDEIGMVFGVTRERIRQLERAALTRLGLPDLRSPAPSRLSEDQWDTCTVIDLPPPDESRTPPRRRSSRRFRVLPQEDMK